MQTRGVLLAALWLATGFVGQGLLQAQTEFPELPEAPQPQRTACLAEAQADLGGGRRAAMPGLPPENTAWSEPPAGNLAASEGAFLPREGGFGIPRSLAECVFAASSLAEGFTCCGPGVDPFARFLASSGPVPLTAKRKFLLAWNDVRAPFNLLTVAGEAGITIGSDAHTAYGPGFPGFAKYAGVSLTQDLTGEFLGTFLIPSLFRQDPRYHRVPNLPIRRRIEHVLEAVVIADGDRGQPMFNYATVLGTIGGSALGNVYIPGRKTNWGASAARVSVALATDPIGGAVMEFLPDVARHINVNIVLVQRVINRVAIAEGAAPAP